VNLRQAACDDSLEHRQHRAISNRQHRSHRGGVHQRRDAGVAPDSRARQRPVPVNAAGDPVDQHAQSTDRRSAHDFSKGSLPNARNLPTDKINDRMAELKKDKPVLLVCATGTSAGRTAALLRSRGFTEVFVLGGGIAGWREAGLPLRT
jgi:rhodanese-related sulfurtransferase